jgi:hypothetical protein
MSGVGAVSVSFTPISSFEALTSFVRVPVILNLQRLRQSFNAAFMFPLLAAFSYF